VKKFYGVMLALTLAALPALAFADSPTLGAALASISVDTVLNNLGTIFSSPVVLLMIGVTLALTLFSRIWRKVKRA